MELALGLYLMKILKVKNNKPFGNMIDKYIILNIQTKEFFVGMDDNTAMIFDSFEEASTICGIYELDGCVIAKIVYKHEED
jgi:hypothetical protein